MSSLSLMNDANIEIEADEYGPQYVSSFELYCQELDGLIYNIERMFEAINDGDPSNSRVISLIIELKTAGHTVRLNFDELEFGSDNQCNDFIDCQCQQRQLVDKALLDPGNPMNVKHLGEACDLTKCFIGQFKSSFPVHETVQFPSTKDARDFVKTQLDRTGRL